MTEQDFLNLGGKKWIKNDMERVYIDADVFNELMDTSLGDRNNQFFYDCKTKCLMRSYKGKKPQIEVQYKEEAKMKDQILAKIEEERAIPYEMKEIADGIKFEFSATGTDTLWFTYDCETYGAYFDHDGFGVIDSEGLPFDEQWLNENYALVEVLKAAWEVKC